MGGAGVRVGVGMGWYGPLIDLSAAASYVGDFVQLLVFIHRSTPRLRQCKSGRLLRRTDIDVGDETRPFFCISVFNDHLASAVTAGDILFFQNVMVINCGSMVEARSVEYTSILRLIHPYATILSRGVDDLVTRCPLVVGTAKDKLRKVINWVHRTSPTTTKGNFTTTSTLVAASVASQCLHTPQLWTNTLPCIVTRALTDCTLSTSYTGHFWDNSEYIPLLVKNKAAEVLFGNIIAEKVYQSYKGQNNYLNLNNVLKPQVNAQDDRMVEEKGIGSSSSVTVSGSKSRRTNHDAKSLNFCLIWLIVLKMLLLQRKNSYLKFEALVNPCLALEDGRFEMISVSMPYPKIHVSSETN